LLLCLVAMPYSFALFPCHIALCYCFALLCHFLFHLFCVTSVLCLSVAPCYYVVLLLCLVDVAPCCFALLRHLHVLLCYITSVFIIHLYLFHNA
jgi:hypothetical protein